MATSLIGKRIILNRNNICKIPKRNGYIVLLPEIGEDLPEKTPLLKEDSKLPEFNKFTIEKCIAAIGKQAVETEQGVRNIEEQIKDSDDINIVHNILNPLEELSIPLEITWGIANTLYHGNQSLMPTKSFINIQNRAVSAKSYKHTSQPIFNACKKVQEDKNLQLTQDQSRLLHKFVLEGTLNGLNLSEKDKGKMQYARTKMYMKQKEFWDKIEAATKQFQRTISDPHIMRDFPESYLATVARDPSQPLQGPWTITLKPHIVPTFLEYCPDTYLRFKVWEANVLKCSLFQDKMLQNSSALEEIRGCRIETAQLLGYKNYAEMSMETKMAGSVDNIYNTFDILRETAFPAQEEELHSLAMFATERGFDKYLNEWDIPYWGRKQLRSVYKFEEETLKEYFPLPNVLNGLYKIFETLFQIKIVEERKVDVWHKDVRFFDVFELDGSNSEPIASFYLDPYARHEHKGPNVGSTTTIKYRSKITGDIPLAALIFNFQPPKQDVPSLLTFKNVNDLFHKFGYVLRHLLTKTDYFELSTPFEWDAFRITGNFIENRLYEASTLKLIAGHYKTEEPLSDEMIYNLINIRSHLAGYKLCKQMYLSELDLELHSSSQFWTHIMNRLWKKYFVIPPDKKDSHVCSFSEIFGDQWGAAYFSVLWSEIIAADAYSAFQEIPEGDIEQEKEIGMRFRDTFLALGGNCPSNEIFRKFRGRDPSPKALLKNLNLKLVKPEVIKASAEILKPDLLKQ